MITFGAFGALFIGLIIILSVVGGEKKKSYSTSKDHDHDHHAHAAGGLREDRSAEGQAGIVEAAPPMTIDTSKTYVAHVATTCGNSTSRSTPRWRRRRSTASCSSPRTTSTTASRSTASPRTS